MGRLKKALGAKLATLNSGQSIIKKHLGQNGVKITCFFEEFSHFCTDEKTTKKLKKYLYKIIAKIGILYEDKKITDKEIEEIVPPIIRYSQNFSDQASMSLLMLGYEMFQADWEEIRKAFESLLKGKVREKTLERLRFISSIMGSPEFNQKFFETKEAHIVNLKETTTKVFDEILEEYNK